MIKSNFAKCGNRGPKGDNGHTPYIGDNGNWWINGEDTGKPSRGMQGQIGYQGYTPYIGDNGNWWINKKDTGISAKGTKGDKGEKGEKGDKGEKGEKGEKGDNGIVTPEVIDEIKLLLEKSISTLDLHVNEEGHLIMTVNDDIQIK